MRNDGKEWRGQSPDVHNRLIGDVSSTVVTDKIGHRW